MRFTDILHEYNIDSRQGGQHHHVTEGWIGIDCPHCSRDSKRFRMGYNVATGRLHCWVCGPQNLVNTLHEITGESYSKLKELTGSLERVQLLPARHTGKLKLPEGIQPLGKAHRRYLESRGFDPDELAELWGVQAISLAAKLSWRLWIPVHQRGVLVSWTTRSIANASAGMPLGRYISAPKGDSAVPLKSLLYGEDFVMYGVIVCEGPVDVWKIGYGAAATLGVGYSHEQLVRIGRYPVRCVCFDAEGKAQARARKLCNNLSVYPGKTINIVLESGKDPGEANKQELRELRRLIS